MIVIIGVKLIYSQLDLENDRYIEAKHTHHAIILYNILKHN